MARIHEYEVAYVVDAELPPEEITALKDKIADVAKGQGAEVGEITQWDRRRMTYSIHGKREAVYIFMKMKASAVAVDEVARSLRLTEPVLRHLVVRPDLS